MIPMTKGEDMSKVKEEPTDVDDFLAHFGVKGMKWGKRKDSSTIAEAIGLTSGPTPRDKQGNIKKPSYGRAMVVGNWANSKKRFTDPQALKNRTTAGKLAGVALLASLGSTAPSIAGSSGSGNSGLAAVGGLLNRGSGLVGTAALVTGVFSVHQERKARSEATS